MKQKTHPHMPNKCISAQASDTPFSSFQNYFLEIEYEISSRIKEIEYKIIIHLLFFTQNNKRNFVFDVINYTYHLIS
jgi:hypothetical protein